MNLAFIMSPLAGIKISEESTFFLMAEAQKRGHRLFLLEDKDLCIREGELFLNAKPTRTVKARHAFDCKAPKPFHAAHFDAIFMRKDPPFDAAYMHATMMLDLAVGHALLVNDPRGLRIANEKMYALNFKDVMPKTWVSRDPAWIKELFFSEGRALVVKPLDGHDGRGVIMLNPGDANAISLVDMSTRNGQETVMIQEYIQEVAEGDKRVFVIGGKPYPYALNRIPGDKDFRARAGRYEAAPVTAHEKRLIKKMETRFAQDGIHFAGLDVVGGKITEINVTSPGLIWRLSQFHNVNLEGAIIDYVEKEARKVKKKR